jgi:hypothetical protein
MHQLIANSGLTDERKKKIKQNKTVNIIVAMLVMLVALNLSVNNTQASNEIEVSNNTIVSVPTAHVIWTKTYGGTGDDRAFFGLPIIDGYLVVGSSRSIVANTTVGWALKLNKDGIALWNKTFLEGGGTELRYAVNLTDGYLLVGNEFFVSGQVRGYVARIDNQGNLQWTKILSEGTTDKLFSGVVTSDGFMVFGSSLLRIDGKSSAWIVKLDFNGNMVWSRLYNESTNSVARSGAVAQDGDCVVTGYTDVKSDGNYNFYLLKVDAKGNVVWKHTYGGGESQKAYSIAKADDGYIIVGDIQLQNTASDAWIVKIDSAGNMVWNKSIGGKDADSAAYVTDSLDGNYLVAGFTFSFGSGNRDFWLLKISNTEQVLWSCTQGDQGFQEAYAVIDAGNNSYVMVGWTDPIGHSELIGKATYDFSITEINFVQHSSFNSSFNVSPYSLAVVVILLAVLFLLFRLRSKVKKKISVKKGLIIYS